MDTGALISIEEVVNSYMNELGDYSLENYERYCQIVIEGLTDFNINHTYSITPLEEVVNDIGIIKLPPDFIDYVVIGVVEHGVIKSLSKNENIALPLDSSCGIDVAHEDRPSKMTDPYWLDYTFGGGWNIGRYRVDYQKRLIVFLETGMQGRSVYIEYISSGISVSNKTMVDRRLLPVLKSYLNYIIVNRNPETNINIKDWALREYGHAYGRYIRSKNKFTADELLDAIRSGYSMGAKR
jgi:hypothetical protein